jgi:hypothetical protein
MTREEVLAITGGADLRREIDGLSAIRKAVHDDDDGDDDNELPHLDHTMMYDGDDDDDDANEIDDLLNIVDVAMNSGMTEPY